MCLASMPYLVRKSLENLYARGVNLRPSVLYRKIADCGIPLHKGRMLRTRMTSLEKRVPKEPPYLTKRGAQAWHKMVLRPFEENEIRFMISNFPDEIRDLYPSLFKENDGNR